MRKFCKIGQLTATMAIITCLSLNVYAEQAETTAVTETAATETAATETAATETAATESAATETAATETAATETAATDAAVTDGAAAPEGTEIAENETTTEAEVFETLLAPDANNNYGQDAYSYLEAIFQNFPERQNQENDRSANADRMGKWIVAQLEGFGYEVNAVPYVHQNYTGINYFVTKQGTSDDIIYVGAHYDSVDTTGTEDNGSGVSTVLELAKRFANEETPSTIYFCFYDNEEHGGYVGSYQFITSYLIPNNLLDNALCNINIDCVCGGDRLYAYGGVYNEKDILEQEWVYKAAMKTAENEKLNLYTLPEAVEDFKSPTRILGSDHHYFMENGVPYVYFEASLWCNPDGSGGNDDTNLTCHYETANEAFASTGGQIMHTEFDNLDRLNQLLPGRVQQNLTNTSQIISGMLRTMSTDTEAEMASYTVPKEITEELTEEATSENASLAEEKESKETTGIFANFKPTTILWIALGVAGAALLVFVSVILYHIIQNNRRRKKRRKRLINAKKSVRNKRK